MKRNKKTKVWTLKLISLLREVKVPDFSSQEVADAQRLIRLGRRELRFYPKDTS